MNTLKNRIAAKPGLCSLLMGLAVLLMGLAAFTVYMGTAQLRRMDAAHRAVAVTIQSITAEARQRLRKLEREYQPVCTEDNLVRLRTEAFSSSYIGDIGVFDEQGRLICTSLLGKLPGPVEVPTPDIETTAVTGERLKLNFNIPLLIGKGRFKTTIIRYGRFNIVINPKNMDEVYAKGVDVIRYQTSSDGAIDLYSNPLLPADWKERFAQRDMTAEPVLQFSWHEWAFVASQQVDGTRLVTQSAIPAMAFFRQHQVEFFMALQVCLLLAVLTYGATLPVCRRWSLLEQRIGTLLTDENIICTYQPVVDLRTGKPVGCEVLMRLQDGRTVLQPDQVLHAVVQHKLTWELDSRVVRKAIGELCRHVPDMRDLKVAFNFFPTSIHSARLRALIEGELKRAGHPGFRFNLEVIEKEYQASLLKEIGALKEAGYLVSMDDFGTGYSNLGSIKMLSPDFLKIDKSFVFEMEDASVRSSLIPEIVGIARAVGARLIAEGIENDAQRAMLLAFGVEYGQGYLFARPMRIEPFVRYLRAAAQDDASASAVAEQPSAA